MQWHSPKVPENHKLKTSATSKEYHWFGGPWRWYAAEQQKLQN